MVIVVDSSSLQRVMVDTVFIDGIDTIGFFNLVG